MSRAFVREDDARPDEPALPVDEREAPVTPLGHARLTERLAELARQPTEGRATRQLARRLERLHVVHGPPPDRERVAFGARVTVEGEDGGRATFRIVGPDETAFHEGGVSVASPVARALLGARVGDAVRVQRPRGAHEVVICQVVYADP
ncbi:MAG: GreA/GreB family elongation factor [Polyangiaceae bacterium]|nr:GreA/GreB family elongation factor [Polyangiaceae bacterium]